MVRLQTAMGAEGIRRSSHVTRAVRPHMAARYSPLQQVSLPAVSLFNILITSSIVPHYITFYTYSSGTACCQEIGISLDIHFFDKSSCCRLMMLIPWF